jgi:all-trans-retinol dehydrogenase (NAD+)
MEHILDILPLPRKPIKALVLAILLFMIREVTFPLREKKLKGKTALITGGGSGIGRLMGLRLAKDGCNVIIWDINLEGAQKVAEEIKTLYGVKSGAYKVDVSAREVVYSVATQTLNDWNRVDILINNAGIVEGKKLLEADDARQELTIKINTLALLWVTKAFLPGMMQRKDGHIVTIASSAGRVGVNGMVAYCASKFGAVGFDESLRGEMRNTCPEIKTTVVCPGYINTGMFSGAKMRSTIPALQPLVDYLMPVLEPDYVAEKIITAIKRNQTILVMPKFAYTSYLFRAVTPTYLLDIAFDILGVSRSMEKFEQTRA